MPKKSIGGETETLVVEQPKEEEKPVSKQKEDEIRREYEAIIRGHIEKEKKLAQALIALSGARNQVIQSIEKVLRDCSLETKVINIDMETNQIQKLLIELGVLNEK